MAANDVYDIENLYCCVSQLVDSKHFVEAPIKLSCGHSACKKCITISTVYCEKCNTENYVDLDHLKESFEMKTLLSMHYEEMVENQEKRYNESFIRSESSIFSKKRKSFV